MAYGGGGHTKEKTMDNKCRHIKFSGERCEAYALRGEPLCYFHKGRHAARKKPPGVMDSIDIPFLEDRCAIQYCITQVVRAIVNNTLDRARASTVLYGLQLALQCTDRKHWAIGFDTATAVSLTPDGDEIAADPEGEYEEEESEDEEDDAEEEEDDESEVEEEDAEKQGAGDENDEENGTEFTEELIAKGKSPQSVHQALKLGGMRQAAPSLSRGG
jgi:hypothetical protein